tara:strand:+ start:482 stop:946 length:465 start_codon:yes stop_codon:yes gene_type:complete
MSFIAAPYVFAGTVSLLLGYNTYNSYYNQPFEYLEIDGLNNEQTDKTQENDTIKPKIVIEEEETKEEIRKPLEEEIIEKVSTELVKNVIVEVLNNECKQEMILNKPVIKVKKLEIMETIKEVEVLVKSPIETKPRNTNNNIRKRRKKKNNRKRK